MKNILEFLENTAPKFGGKTAFADETESLSFTELLSLSKAGGSLLAGRGIYRQPVAVFMDKAPRTIAAFFAVMYAGCCYVPLERSMPRHRLRMILQRLEPQAIICDEASAGLASELGWGDKLIPCAELFAAEVNEEALAGIRAKCIDTDPAYIVFTSGSTGVPKGVTACHRSVIDYANALCPVIGAAEDSRFAMQVPLYVDAGMKEVLSVIKCGSTAFLMQQSLFMSPLRVLDFLNRHEINTVCWVASALTLVSGLGAFEEGRPEYLRTVCFGSEVFHVKQLHLWQRACPGARFINLYGPTEATGMSFYFVVDRDFAEGEPIPVGRPFDNTDFLLLREDDTEAPAGETGEICIRGTAVSLGRPRPRGRRAGPAHGHQIPGTHRRPRRQRRGVHAKPAQQPLPRNDLPHRRSWQAQRARGACVHIAQGQSDKEHGPPHRARRDRVLRLPVRGRRECLLPVYKGKKQAVPVLHGNSR